MSKLIDSLNKVQASLTTANPAKNIPPSVIAVPRKEEAAGPSHLKGFQLTSQIFYSVAVSMVLIVVLAVTLSYKAFALIQERNTHIAELAGAVTRQNEKIKSLEESITSLSLQQTRLTADLKTSLGAIEQRINKTTKEIAEIVISNENIDDQIKGLKDENKNTKNNYNSLTAEINKVKQLLARMMGETTEP